MTQHLLLIELATKGISGALLLLFPRTLARILGLPPVSETFWPRLLGAVLVSLAVAIVLEAQLASKSGLGLAGLVAINLVTALALTGLLIMDRTAKTRRGRAFIILFVVATTILALFELAWI